jgi:hypothetical protein
VLSRQQSSGNQDPRAIHLNGLARTSVCRRRRPTPHSHQPVQRLEERNRLHLVHEIAVLADQHRRAGHAFTSDALEEWHRYSLPAFTERMKTRLKNHCEDGHQPWPAKGRHTRHTAEASCRAREDRFAADVGAVPTEARGRRRPRLGLVDLDTGEIKDL